jgi:hypothetical protein
MYERMKNSFFIPSVDAAKRQPAKTGSAIKNAPD